MQTYTKGFLITLVGVLAITPDTLLVRLVDADVWAQTFWRGLLTGIAILTAFVLFQRRQSVSNIQAMGLPGLWVTIIFALGNLCFLYSVTHTSIANTLFINSTSPVLAALMAWAFLKEAISLRIWMTIGGTLVGIGIIAIGSLDRSASSQLGDFAALGSAAARAATFSIARAYKSVSMVPAAGMSGLLSALIAYFLADSLVIAQEDWIWIILAGLVVVPLGFALLTTGPRYLPAPDVSLLLLLEAVFAPLVVWWLLAEHPGNYTLVGGAVVLVVMVVSNVAVLRRSPG
ncbi:MAG: drug/metabolite transporter (DMT)-like permease [Paracoccaceae bacterium]|jgi:drug/metabolite transporter (DMT)-like permease